MSNNGSMDRRSSMSNNGSMDSLDEGSSGVDRGTLIGDLSNESKLVVSVVGGGLNSAIGKVDGVGSSNVSSSILRLGLSVVSSAVVIAHSILVGEGLRGFIIGVGGSSVGGGREGGSSGHKSGGKDDLVHVYWL